MSDDAVSVHFRDGYRDDLVHQTVLALGVDLDKVFAMAFEKACARVPGCLDEEVEGFAGKLFSEVERFFPHHLGEDMVAFFFDFFRDVVFEFNGLSFRPRRIMRVSEKRFSTSSRQADLSIEYTAATASTAWFISSTM